MAVQKQTSKALEKLTEALGNLDHEQYPDVTSDFPIEELRIAIKDGDESEDSPITSAEQHLQYFKNTTL